MSPQRRLMLASILFAVLWTAGMIWWTAPNMIGAIILMVGGAIAGTLWFFAMRWYFKMIARA